MIDYIALADEAAAALSALDDEGMSTELVERLEQAVRELVANNEVLISERDRYANMLIHPEDF